MHRYTSSRRAAPHRTVVRLLLLLLALLLPDEPGIAAESGLRLRETEEKIDGIISDLKS